MKFDIQQSIKLLSPEYFHEVFDSNNCRFLVSVFNDAHHNFIIPTSRLSEQDIEKNMELLADFKKKGLEFSYYVPEEIDKVVGELVKSSGLLYDCTTRYVFKDINERYQIPEKEVVKLNESNLYKFLDAAAICFPGWNNVDFTEWCLACPSVEMLAVVIEDEIAAFAGYLSKPDHDYVLLMNAGTLPKFRRQGLHEYLIKKRINDILGERASAGFYADVDEGEASHKGFRKLGFEDGDVFVGYN